MNSKQFRTLCPKVKVNFIKKGELCMTREQLQKKIEKVQYQILELQEREKELIAEKEMADMAASREIIEKKKISPEMLTMLSRYSEQEIRLMLEEKKQKEGKNEHEKKNT